MATGLEPANGHGEGIERPGMAVPRGRRGGDPADARKVVLRRARDCWGNPFLPYARQGGARPGLEHEQSEPVEC